MHVFPLGDGFVGLGSTGDVVGLDGEKLLKCVGASVCLQRPDLHLSEPLPAELSLSTQGLLRDQSVRPCGACMDLVLHKVDQLHHVNNAHRHRLIEWLTGAAIVQYGLPMDGRRDGCFSAYPLHLLLDFLFSKPLCVDSEVIEPEAQTCPLGLAVVLLTEYHRRVESPLLEPFSGPLQPAFGGHVAGAEVGLSDYPGPGQRVLNNVCVGALKHRAVGLETQFVGGPAEMRLEYLPQVHTRRYADGV